MRAPAPILLLKGFPPGGWTALSWGVATLYSVVAFVRWPGEVPDVVPHRGWDRDATAWAYLATGTVLALAGSALLRRRPLPAVGLLLAGAVAAAMAMNSTRIGLPQFLAVAVALCFIAAERPRRTSLAATGAALGVLVGHASVRLLLGYPIGTSAQVAVALTAVIAWLAGDSIRQARVHAERIAAQAAAQAVTAERLRISREVHDLVAHSIGIIALQAGAASRVIDTQPAAARTAMTAVETASRETLSGLRRVLGAREGATVLAPAPGLADVDRLAATATAAGVHVEVRRRGEHRPLPPDIDLSAYRIIQEAVTNVVRHAGARSCRVCVDQRDGELVIEVEDDGRGGGDTAGSGHGLTGMRERVGLLSGDFSAGALPGGGFRVTARLPLPAGAR